jgi:uncharacterized beta-barrel protein YwiB (DUF1934 family)
MRDSRIQQHALSFRYIHPGPAQFKPPCPANALQPLKHLESFRTLDRLLMHPSAGAGDIYGQSGIKFSQHRKNILISHRLATPDNVAFITAILPWLIMKLRYSTLKTMNEQKRNVRIRIATAVDGSKHEYEAEGIVYVKGDNIYIRYEETSPDVADVMTTVKVGASEITLLRRGPVRSDMRFLPGKPAGGMYETGQIAFRLETVTEWLEAKFDGNGIGSAEWVYRLWVDDAEAGHHHVKMDVQEG